MLLETLKTEQSIEDNKMNLINYISSETKWNNLIDDNDKKDLQEYIDKKKWDSNVVDLMPAIWSDYLNVSILVFRSQ